MSRALRLVVFASLWGACVVEDPEQRRFDDDEGSGGTSAVSSSTTIGSGGATSATTSTSAAISTTGVTTSSSTTTGGGCNDPFPEPNNTQATALDLGIIDSCDGSQQSEDGVLKGNDIDWFRYYVDDGFCFVDPLRQITSDGQARLCKYFECDTSPATTTVTCPAGTQADTAPQGQPGCCGLTMFEPEINCGDTYVWVRIDKPSAQTCVSYTFTYRF